MKPAPHAASFAPSRSLATRSLIALSLAVPSLAHAAPPEAPAPPAEARDESKTAAAKEKFLAGREELKRGEIVQALSLFRASQALYPAPGTLLNVANCEEQLGLLAAAWQHFKAVLALLPASDDRRPIAAVHADDLAPRVPRVTIHLAREAPPGTTVSLDDVPLDPSNLGVELPLDPGRHTIVVTAPSVPNRRYTLTVTEGQRLVNTVAPWHGQAFSASEWARVEELSKLDKKSEPAPAPASNGPPGARGGVRRTAALVIGGVGIVGLGIGAASGVVAISVNDQLKAMCPVPAMCTPTGVAMAHVDRTLAGVSSFALAFGATALAGGVTLAVTTPDAPRVAMAIATPVPGGVAFGVRGQY
jgi:hypothetical protein